MRHLYTVKVKLLLLIIGGLHAIINSGPHDKLPVNAISDVNITVHETPDFFMFTVINAFGGVYPVTCPDKGVTVTSEITVANRAEYSNPLVTRSVSCIGEFSQYT